MTSDIKALYCVNICYIPVTALAAGLEVVKKEEKPQRNEDNPEMTQEEREEMILSMYQERGPDSSDEEDTDSDSEYEEVNREHNT